MIPDTHPVRKAQTEKLKFREVQQVASRWPRWDLGPSLPALMAARYYEEQFSEAIPGYSLGTLNGPSGCCASVLPLFLY